MKIHATRIRSTDGAKDEIIPGVPFLSKPQVEIGIKIPGGAGSKYNEVSKDSGNATFVDKEDTKHIKDISLLGLSEKTMYGKELNTTIIYS